MTTDTNDLVVVGKITTVYGVKGWVKVHSYTEPMENLFGYPSLYLQRNGQWQALAFAECRHHQKGLIALIEGVSERETARTYCQCDIAIPAGDMPSLEEGEYYWHQLEGLQVIAITPAGEEVLLGEVQHLIETGANDVMVVKQCRGSVDDRERLIPWLLEQVVKEVDLQAGTLKVEWDPEF